MAWAETMAERVKWLAKVRTGALLMHRNGQRVARVVKATRHEVWLQRINPTGHVLSSKVRANRWVTIYDFWRLADAGELEKWGGHGA